MKSPIWITATDCLALHNMALDRFGGIAGIRDEGLLDSALHRPQQLYLYGKPDLFVMAAALASGIVKNHPFFDGNKRSGFLAAALFLESNGVPFAASEEEVVLQTLGLAAGEVSEADYAQWLKVSCPSPKKKRRPRT